MDTVGKNKQRIQEYIKRQLEQDQIADQLSLVEFTDPFTEVRNQRGVNKRLRGLPRDRNAVGRPFVAP